MTLVARVSVALMAVAFAALALFGSAPVVSTQQACGPSAPTAPMRVTADCIDPRFNKPYVDIEEERTAPVPHRYVHGGDFPVAGQLAAPGSSVSVSATHSYSQPGTYFPVLRATSQREGDSKTSYARVQNLGRVRVVVK